MILLLANYDVDWEDDYFNQLFKIKLDLVQRILISSIILVSNTPYSLFDLIRISLKASDSLIRKVEGGRE